LYALPNIIRVIKSRRMRWAIDHLEDTDVDEKIKLGWILGKEGGKVWTGCTLLRIGTSG